MTLIGLVVSEKNIKEIKFWGILRNSSKFHGILEDYRGFHAGDYMGPGKFSRVLCECEATDMKLAREKSKYREDA